MHLVTVSGVRLEERLPVRVPQFHRLVLAARDAVVAVDVVTDRSHGALASISTFPLSLGEFEVGASARCYEVKGQ